MNLFKKFAFALYLSLPLLSIYYSYQSISTDHQASDRADSLVEYIFSKTSKETLDINFDPNMLPNGEIRAIYINDEFYFNGLSDENIDLAFDYFVKKHSDNLNLRVFENTDANISVAYTIDENHNPFISIAFIAIFVALTLYRANKHGEENENLRSVNKALNAENAKIIKSNKDLRQIVRNCNEFNFSDLNGTVHSKLEEHLGFDCSLQVIAKEIENESISNQQLHDSVLSYKNKHVGNAYQRFEKFLGEKFDRTDDREDVLISLKTDFEMTKEFSNTASEKLELVSKELKEANKTINSLSEDLKTSKHGFEQASIKVQELIALIDSSNTVNATMDTLSTDCLTNSQAAESVSKDAAQDMNQIKEFSRKISSIINLIEDIAFQTQLLALNANVEAARAGEHGKGFAVVAGEVKQLAVRASESSEQIKKLIQESLTSINSGVKQVESTADALKTITSSVEKINKLSKDLSSTTSEQVETISSLDDVIKSTKIEDQYASYKEAVRALNKGMESLDKQTTKAEEQSNSNTTTKNQLPPKHKSHDAKPIGSIELIKAKSNEDLDNIPAHHKNKGDYNSVKHTSEDWEEF